MRAAWATMPGWLVMIAGPRSCGCGLAHSGRGQARGDARMGAPCRPRCYPGCCRGRVLGRRAAAAGPGRVDERCWLRAGGVGPGHGSADPGRGAREHAAEFPAAAKGGPVARAWPQGPGCRRDADTRGPPPIGALRLLFQGHEHPPVQACFHCRRDGHRRAVGPAPPAAADGTRDRQRTLYVVFYVPWMARAVQQRRPRIAAGWALVMAGSVARLRAAAAEPLR